ncbi:uncharacterized protein [Pyxicephalus adspersus]
MIRFLLLLLLLPGAELTVNTTDAEESFASTTLGAQFTMAVTPKTTLSQPIPASRGPANKTAVPLPPPVKDGKKQHSFVRDVSVTPAKVQPVQRDANTSNTNSFHYHQRNSTLDEPQPNSTKMPVTARSHSFSVSPQKRPVVRKGQIVPSKAKTVPKFTMKNSSARYQSLPHIHHKNATSKPATGQLKDSNFTSGSTGLTVSSVPQRTATKPGQKAIRFLPDRVEQFPVTLQALTQMGGQMKEKSSNTSVLLNTLVNQNSSFLTNSLQHISQSSNATFTTGKEAVLYELNSLNTHNHLLNSENVTSVPEPDQHNDVSRAGLLRNVNLPGERDSEFLKELKPKVNLRIPERNIFSNAKLNSTDSSGIVPDDTANFHPELTTQTSVIGHGQTDILATQMARTTDNVSQSNGRPHELTEAATEVQSRGMTGVATQTKKDHRGMTGGHQNHHNQTHSHKHRHQVLEPLNQAETNTISQHEDAPYDRTAFSEPNRHHQKHSHNHTQPHSHSHHKHRSDHHLQRYHVSQTLGHLNTAADLTTQPSESNSHHTDLVTSTQRQISIQNDTNFSTRLPSHSYMGALQGNQTGSVRVEGLSEMSGTAPSTTQKLLDSQSEISMQPQEPTTSLPTSVTDVQTVVHKLNSVEQSSQSEAYPSLHTKPAIYRHSESHTRYNLTQTTQFNVTTHPPLDVTKEPQLDPNPPTMDERITKNQSGTHSSQEELTTSTQDQQTFRSQPNLTFPGLHELSTSEVSTQAHPKVITQTLPHLGTQVQPELSTEQNFFTRVWSVMSTQKPPFLTTKSPLIPITVSMPSLTTQSHSEATGKNLPNSETFVYANKTQPESFTDSHSKENAQNLGTQKGIEFSTNTEPITDNSLESTDQTRPASKSPIELNNYTETNTHIKSSTQAEIITVPEIVMNVTSESINKTEPILQGGTKVDFQTEPITNSRTDSTSQNEPESRRDSTTKQKTTTVSKTHPTIKPEWVIDETDTQKQTKAPLHTHTESTTHMEPTTTRRAETTTQLQSTTEHLLDFTNTEPITRHMAEHDTEKEPTKIESSTQAKITIHSWDKTEPDLQFETGPTNKSESTSKSTFTPSVPSDVSTSNKGLIQTTQSNAGTATYLQPTTRTGPELTMNAKVEASMQTTRDEVMDIYTPTERTPFTKDRNVTEHRIEGSAPIKTGGYDVYTQNGVQHSRTTPAVDVETYHSTSRFPFGGPHQTHATTVKNYRSPSSTKSVTSPQSSTFTPQTLSEMMSSPSGRDRIFIVDEQPPVFKVPTISVTYKVNVQQSAMCNDLEPCKKHFSKEVTSVYKYTAGFDRADVINVTLSGTALEYKVQFNVRAGSPMSMEQELVLANPTSVFEAFAPSDYTLLSTIRNASLADMVEPCTEWFSCPRGFRCMPQRKLSAFCLSPCHSTFCQNDGICIHRKGQEPACQCPVGRDFWYMGPTCDYRMTHHRLAAIACAVVFCIIICAAAAVFILVRRFQTQILHQKVAQTQSSYRRFSRLDDVPTHFWCPSQTWLTTSASINSLDNPAFSSSEEVFPLQALGSCVCGCQDGARSNAPADPAQQPSRAPPR